MAKKGFTLSEVMITMTIIGVLAITLMPILNNLRPNKSQIMFKKAYYTLENTVSLLLNDEALYPQDDTLVGLRNTATAFDNGHTYNVPTTKFCELFASKVNLAGSANCAAGGFEFTTNDGIVWNLPTATFGDGTTSQVITVDVFGGTTNTSHNNPNCIYNASTCTHPDQFNIFIVNDGTLKVTGDAEKEYLGNTTQSTDVPTP